MVDTHGIPLDIVLDKLRDAGMMPDWVEFYEVAVSRGWKPSGVITKLSEAVGDVYGPVFRETWERQFKSIIQRERGG
jgi:hypothetical protein